MKKIICSLFLAAFLLSGSQSFAQPIRDFDFNQERMVISKNRVYLLSSFDVRDYITCYNFYGDLLWSVPFHAKIISWRMVGDNLIVFSKDRAGDATYITNMDAITGSLIWQRP